MIGIKICANGSLYKINPAEAERRVEQDEVLLWAVRHSDSTCS